MLPVQQSQLLDVLSFNMNLMPAKGQDLSITFKSNKSVMFSSLSRRICAKWWTGSFTLACMHTCWGTSLNQAGHKILLSDPETSWHHKWHKKFKKKKPKNPETKTHNKTQTPLLRPGYCCSSTTATDVGSPAPRHWGSQEESGLRFFISSAATSIPKKHSMRMLPPLHPK